MARKAPTGADTITLRIDTSSVDNFIAGIGADLQKHVLPAVAAGAKVIYDEVHANVDAIGQKSGNLKKSIYRVYSKANSTPNKAVYHISWNYKKAPHGRWLEWGRMQRYKTYIGKDGKWHTAVRPGMRGKKPPSSRASLAVKDAYYVPLKGGPIQRPGYAFIRRAESAIPRALAAMEERLFRGLSGNV